MAELLRVGAVARLDKERSERDRLADLGHGVAPTPEQRHEFEEFVAEYERGGWRLVRLELFADLAEPDRPAQRFDSVHVEGLWFKVPHGPDNDRHAQEAADQHLDRLHQHLNEAGFEIVPGELESVPFRLELDDQLREAIGAG